jgi:hypothetical protein
MPLVTRAGMMSMDLQILIQLFVCVWILQRCSASSVSELLATENIGVTIEPTTTTSSSSASELLATEYRCDNRAYHKYINLDIIKHTISSTLAEQHKWNGQPQIGQRVQRRSHLLFLSGAAVGRIMDAHNAAMHS